MGKRTLRDLGQSYCVLYDDETGEVLGRSKGAARGWTAMLGGQRVAEYVDDDHHLILQIATDKFDLDSSETEADGRNDYETNTSNFRIVQGDRQRHLRYPGWWTDFGFGEAEVMGRAEMGEYEDSLGWVWRMLSDPAAREGEKQRLLSLSCS